MEKTMTIGHQYRYGRNRNSSGSGYFSHDLPTAPKLVIANHYLKRLGGFAIGEKIKVVYSLGSVTISKIN